MLDIFRSSGTAEERHYRTFPATDTFDKSPEMLPGTLLEIKPFKQSEGKVERGANLLQTLHDVHLSEGENVSDSHAFEVWFDRGEFKFRLYASNPRAKDRFQRRVANTYTNAEVYELDDCQALPTIKEGEYVAGSRLDEKRHTFLPIRDHEGTGFPHGDPYSDILGEMLTLDDSVVVLQVIFKPARHDWTDSGPNGQSVEDIAAELRSGTVVGMKDPLVWAGIREMEERKPTERDKQAAKLVEAQRGKQGFHVNIRILAVSPEPREAMERARGVSGLFRKVYSTDVGQKFIDFPVSEGTEELDNFLKTMLFREWTDRKMILSIDELAGIAHIPNHEIEVPQIDWKTTEAGSEVAAKAGKDQKRTAGGGAETPRDKWGESEDIPADEPVSREDDPEQETPDAEDSLDTSADAGSNTQTPAANGGSEREGLPRGKPPRDDSHNRPNIHRDDTPTENFAEADPDAQDDSSGDGSTSSHDGIHPSREDGQVTDDPDTNSGAGRKANTESGHGDSQNESPQSKPEAQSKSEVQSENIDPEKLIEALGEDQVRQVLEQQAQEQEQDENEEQEEINEETPHQNGTQEAIQTTNTSPSESDQDHSQTSSADDTNGGHR